MNCRIHLLAPLLLLVRPTLALAQPDTLSVMMRNITVQHRHYLDNRGNVADHTTRDKNWSGGTSWVFDTVERRGDLLHYFSTVDTANYFADVVYNPNTHAIVSVNALNGTFLTEAPNINTEYQYLSAHGGTATEDQNYFHLRIHRTDLDSTNVRLISQANSIGSGDMITFESRIFLNGQGGDTSFVYITLTKSEALSSTQHGVVQEELWILPNPATDNALSTAVSRDIRCARQTGANHVLRCARIGRIRRCPRIPERDISGEIGGLCTTSARRALMVTYETAPAPRAYPPAVS
jgi:hypothetical protein